MISKPQTFTHVLLLLMLALSIEVKAQDVDISDPATLKNLNSLPEDLKRDIMARISDQNIETNADQLVTNSLRESSDESQEENLNSKKTFGHEFFNFIPSNPTPFSDLPIKSEIILSEGDKLELFISGSTGNDGIFPLQISLDGTVLFDEFGKVSLSGLTFQEAEQKLSSFLSQFIIFSNVSLTLTELSVVEISIVGAVNSPGIYRVNPASSVIGVLQYAGGISDYGSFRKIEHRTGDKISEIDLYDILISGKYIKTRPLRSGDVIFVNPSNSVIEIKGQVRRPGIYEIKNEKYLSEILDLALGEIETSDLKNVYVETFSGKSLEVEEYQEISFSKVSSIFVPKQPLNLSRSLKIYGPLLGKKSYTDFSPDFGEFIATKKFANEIYPYFSILLSRNSYSNSTYKITPFSLQDESTYRNIMLKDTENLVFFFKVSDFLEEDQHDYAWKNGVSENIIMLVSQLVSDYAVGLKGDFYNEGAEFPVFGKTNINALITYVGGLRDTAEKDNIQFVDFKNNSSFTVGSDQNTNYYASGNATIFAPSSKKELLSVSIEGEVSYPGLYEMLPGDTLQDLYEKAGGLTDQASKRSILFTRKSIRDKEELAIVKARSDLLDSIINNLANPSVSANVPPISMEIITLYDLSKRVQPTGRLVGDLSPQSNTSIDLKLENGDSIFISRKPSTVNIVGEVQSPLTVSFDIYNDDLLHYIDASGGFTEYSDKNAVYIIKSDGTSISVKNSIFSYRKNLIEPGDTIVVPKKLLQVRGLALISVASKTLSEIAFTAASLNAIRN